MYLNIQRTLHSSGRIITKGAQQESCGEYLATENLTQSRKNERTYLVWEITTTFWSKIARMKAHIIGTDQKIKLKSVFQKQYLDWIQMIKAYTTVFC
jgi:hypothetical protein